MQLSSDHDIEGAFAEYVAAAFSPEERQIAKLKSRLDGLPPRSHARVIVHNEILAVRMRQLGAKWPA